jgi:hypothetical protein
VIHSESTTAVRSARALLASVLCFLLLVAAVHSVEHATTERHQHSAHPCLLCTLAKAQAETSPTPVILFAWQPGVSFTRAHAAGGLLSSLRPQLPPGRAPPA